MAKCAESDAPLCSLGEFLENLGAMGWSHSDIHAVEEAVLQYLGKLKEKSLAGHSQPAWRDRLSLNADAALPAFTAKDSLAFPWLTVCATSKPH